MDALVRLVDQAEDYCIASEANSRTTLDVLKTVFDTSNIVSEKKFGPFQQLIIDADFFDADSIWEEIQSRNKPLNRYLNAKLKKIAIRNQQAEVSTTKPVKDLQAKTYDEILDRHQAKSNQSRSKVGKSRRVARDTAIDSDDVVDDGNNADGIEEVAADPDESEAEDDDVGDDNDEDEEEEEEDEDLGSDDEGFGDEEEDDYEDSDNEKENSSSEPNLTRHARKRAELLEKIADLEQDVVQKKSWEMQGEVKSKQRPENSLLETDGDIDRISKPAPIITQEFTDTLEEMIISRIVGERFDNVVPRVQSKKKDAIDIELSQEKSTLGLGETYANEFLARSMNVDTTKTGTSDLEAEVTSIFLNICRQLDTLSHFHYTPKPVAPEASVSSQAALPAILLEDHQPTVLNFSTATSNKAAQEVSQAAGSEGSLKAQAELTSEDRKRTRRAHKRSARARKSAERVDKRARVAQGDLPAGALDDDEPLRDRRVVQGKVAAVPSSSKSADFFALLNKTSKDHIASKKGSNGGASVEKLGGGDGGNVKNWKL